MIQNLLIINCNLFQTLSNSKNSISIWKDFKNSFYLLTTDTFKGLAKGLDPLMLWGEVFANPLEVSASSSKVSSTVAISSSSPKLLPSDLTLPFMLESVKEDLAIMLSRKRYKSGREGGWSTTIIVCTCRMPLAREMDYISPLN